MPLPTMTGSVQAVMTGGRSKYIDYTYMYLLLCTYSTSCPVSQSHFLSVTFCPLKFLVLHTFPPQLTEIGLNQEGQGGHEKLLLTCSGASTSSRQCFSHVRTAMVHPWETRANIFSCSFTTFSVGEIFFSFLFNFRMLR